MEQTEKKNNEKEFLENLFEEVELLDTLKGKLGYLTKAKWEIIQNSTSGEIKNEYYNALIGLIKESLKEKVSVCWIQEGYSIIVDNISNDNLKLELKKILISGYTQEAEKWFTEKHFGRAGNNFLKAVELSSDKKQKDELINKTIYCYTQAAENNWGISEINHYGSTTHVAFNYYSKVIDSIDDKKDKQKKCIEIGDRFLQRGSMPSYEEAFDFYKHALKISEDIKEKAEIFMHIKEIYEKKYFYVKEIFKIYQEFSNQQPKEVQLEINILEGDKEFENRDYNCARDSYSNALSKFNDLLTDKRKVYLLKRISSSYEKNGNFEKAIATKKEALDLESRLNN